MPDAARLISPTFYDRPPQTVAPDLLGKLLIRRSRTGLTIGRIVETEAYLAQGDSAAHSVSGINRKNASMFGPPGRAYVYTIHARQCFNVVTEATGIGSAVLIRALEPVDGVVHMQRRRGTDVRRDLCRGPARLCEACDIGRELDGWSLGRAERLWIADDQTAVKVQTSERIGVTSAEDLPLRFFAADSRFVSGPRWLNEATR